MDLLTTDEPRVEERACNGACGCSRGDCAEIEPSIEAGGAERALHLRRGLNLEYATIAWNVIEGIVSVLAAVGAGSVALLGFGIDSFIEVTSGLVLVWRLGSERRIRDPAAIERLDARAHKLVAASLFLLAAYVVVEASRTLISHERPEPTIVGVAITLLSLASMSWLASAKRSVAAVLRSRALEADAFQTSACFWLSLITLLGLVLNATLGWWWADPVAALGMTWFLVKEGRQAWRGENCGCTSGGLGG